MAQTTMHVAHGPYGTRNTYVGPLPILAGEYFYVREESIRSEEEGGAYISKYIKGILKSRLSRREQSHWNIIDDITSMAFLKNFRLLIQFFILSYFTGGYTLLLVENTSPHLSIHKKTIPRGERKLQDEKPSMLFSTGRLSNGLSETSVLLKTDGVSSRAEERFN
ncbi:LOW QUALITY PROTEIN: hypothetical protein YC2023_037038 [Brassica napus]